MAGISYYFEDFPEGTVLTSDLKQVDKGEMLHFAREFDPQPVHLDDSTEEALALGGITASRWHIGGMFMRLMYDRFIADTASEGSPGLNQMQWLAPVFAGDTLQSTTTILSARVLKSRPHIGLITCRHELKNQNGAIVLQAENPIMVRLRAPQQEVQP